MGPGLSLGIKLAVPVVLAVGGSAGVLLSSSTHHATTSQVWIDAPTGGSNLAPGSVTVYSHATADTQISDLDLSVDGTRVASTNAFTRTGKLVLATFTWSATAGQHTLVVADPARHASSTPVTIFVGTLPGAGSTTAPNPLLAAPTQTGRPRNSPPPTASTSPTNTRTPISPTSTTTRTSTHPTSSSPHTSTTPTSTAPAVLAIQSVAVSPSDIYYICPGPTTATVTAHVTGASAVTAYYAGNTYPMHLSAGVWTTTISATAFFTNQSGPVSVVAIHPGEKSVNKDTGTLTVSVCKP